MAQIVYCACGKPLHYSDPIKRAAVEQQIVMTGSDVPVRSGNRTFIVPRHYIALHELKQTDLPKLRFPEMLDKAILIPYAHDSGGVRISLEGPDYRDQYFTHRDPDDDMIRHFHVPKLIDLIKRNPESFEIGVFDITEEQLAFVKQNRGIDETHINQRMSDAFLDEPGIICIFPDGSQLIVDGNHRFVLRGQRKMRTMGFWMVPEAIWRKSLLRVPSQFDVV